MGATLTDPLVGQLIDGRYEVLSRIARGGMATVYLATDRRLDRDVALKVMHPHLADGADGADFVSRFRREARAAARLTHPGLVAVFDQGVDGATSYLTMEFVDGTNLRHRLVSDGALSVQDAFDTAEAVLDALAAAHRNNLVHRDIKPENVLLSSEGRIKVADFGLARAVTEVTSTATGTIFGTVAYLAPEIILTGTCDARTDVYAVGILLFEMLTGRQPHTGDTPIQVAYKHVNSDIPAVSDHLPWAPQEIDELVAALAARQPEDRPTDATAALALLARTRAALSAQDLARRADVAPATPASPETAVSPAPAATTTDAPDDDAQSAEDGAAPRALPPVPAPPQDAGSASAPSDRADSADAAEPPVDSDATLTQSLTIGSAGTTIALPMGTTVEDPGASPEAVRRSRERRRRRLVAAALSVLVVAVLAAGITAWWTGYGPGAYTNVPTGLAGQSQDAATEALAGFSLEATPVEEYDDVVPAGHVVRTEPLEGEQIKKGGVVTLVLSRGIQTFTVPTGLVGMERDAAAAAVTDSGLTLGEDQPVHDDKVPAGQVMEVSEAEGATVPHYTVITLTVSDGPAPVTIPQVVNATRDTAETTLKSLGLKVKVTKEYSEDIAKGRVIAQDLEPSSIAHRTDTITLTVSKGRPLVVVPDVRGMATEAAHAKLTELDLVPEDQFAWGGFLGQVRFQSVDAGTKVPKGTTISLTIF